MTDVTSTPSRRTLLCGGGALAAVSSLPLAAVASAPHPDAELLALVAAFEANRAETEALLGPFRSVVTSPEMDAAYRHHALVLSPRFHELKWDIALTPARTREGLLAKAWCALRLACPTEADVPSDDEALSVSVLRDVLGLPPIPAGEG